MIFVSQVTLFMEPHWQKRHEIITSTSQVLVYKFTYSNTDIWDPDILFGQGIGWYNIFNWFVVKKLWNFAFSAVAFDNCWQNLFVSFQNSSKRLSQYWGDC